MASAAEELLRYLSPLTHLGRVLSEDVVVPASIDLGFATVQVGYERLDLAMTPRRR